jgi:NAD(P)-dependent dehydrogenase (short-subunit alcohol dehydrogenase family)
MDWSKRVAIVTGGASGIGAATVREFAQEGAAVALFDINVAWGEELAASLSAEGHRVTFHEVDVSDDALCRRTVQAVAARSNSPSTAATWAWAAKGWASRPPSPVRNRFYGFTPLRQVCA